MVLKHDVKIYKKYMTRSMNEVIVEYDVIRRRNKIIQCAREEYESRA